MLAFLSVKKELRRSSFAAATPLSTGFKTYAGAIGLDLNKEPLTHALKVAEEKGKATGVISSVERTHATPPGFLAARNVNRNSYAEISQKIVCESAVDVVMGGGARDRAALLYMLCDGDGRIHGLAWTTGVSPILPRRSQTEIQPAPTHSQHQVGLLWCIMKYAVFVLLILGFRTEEAVWVGHLAGQIVIVEPADQAAAGTIGAISLPKKLVTSEARRRQASNVGVSDADADVIALGVGTAGQDLSLQLLDAGLDVIAIEDNSVGGECRYWACLPSTSMVRTAKTLEEARWGGDVAADAEMTPE